MDPEKYREQVVNSAKTFKSNWVQFGELLTKVAADKLYEEWGYRKFEDYCRVEIRIKKNTAIKLTNAYFFVTNEDPDIFNHTTSKECGLDLDTVSFLQKAKNDDNCSEDIYNELKESALERGQSSSTLARKYKQMTRDENQSSTKEFHKQNLNLVTRLQQRLSPLENVPDKFKTYLEEMADYFQTQ